MRHESVKKRNEEMRKFKASGRTMREVAEKYGLSVDYVKEICKGIAPQSVSPFVSYESRIERCKEIIKNANEDFEYIRGFSTVDGYVDIRCNKCGYEFSISLITLRHPRPHECPECLKRKLFEAKQEKARQKARQREWAKSLRQSYFQDSMKVCQNCDSLFLGTSKQRFCSQHCRNQNIWMMKDGYRHKFGLDELYKRDNGICYLCGELCDWEDKEVVNGVVVYGNAYPSRDHVIPKSKGGENSWDNIRLAHRICNARKSDSPLY